MLNSIEQSSLNEINNYLTANCLRIGIICEIKDSEIGLWSRIFGYRYANYFNESLQLNDLVWFNIQMTANENKNTFFLIDEEVFEITLVKNIPIIEIPYEGSWLKNQFIDKGLVHLYVEENNITQNLSILYSEMGISSAFVIMKYQPIKFYRNGVWTNVESKELSLLKSKWEELFEFNQEGISEILNTTTEYVNSLKIDSIIDSFNFEISTSSYYANYSDWGRCLFYDIIKTTSTNLRGFENDNYLIEFFSVHTALFKGIGYGLHRCYEKENTQYNLYEYMDSEVFQNYISDRIQFVKDNARQKYDRQDHINKLVFVKLKEYFENITNSTQLLDLKEKDWNLKHAISEWNSINKSYDIHKKVKALNDYIRFSIKSYINKGRK